MKMASVAQRRRCVTPPPAATGARSHFCPKKVWHPPPMCHAPPLPMLKRKKGKHGRCSYCYYCYHRNDGFACGDFDQR